MRFDRSNKSTVDYTKSEISETSPARSSNNIWVFSVVSKPLRGTICAEGSGGRTWGAPPSCDTFLRRWARSSFSRNATVCSDGESCGHSCRTGRSESGEPCRSRRPLKILASFCRSRKSYVTYEYGACIKCHAPRSRSGRAAFLH